jgi:iron transport multicopper oxidase
MEDLLNLEGATVAPPPLPAGFTTRGIIALLFSVFAAILGMAAVARYGMAELSVIELERAKRKIVHADDGVLRGVNRIAVTTADG